MLTERNNVGVQFVLGMVLPLALLGVVIANLATGTVMCPTRVGRAVRLVWSNDPTLITAWVVVKLAVAIGLVSWFLLANRPQTQKLAVPGVLLAAAMILAVTVVALVQAVWF